MLHKIFSYLVVGVLTFAVGTYFGSAWSSLEFNVDGVDADMQLFAESWSLLEEFFEGSEGHVLPTAEERVRGAVEGLVKSYNDPHSAFLAPELAKRFEEDTQGNFGGVGMEIDSRDDLIVVVAPLKGTPAEAAGLRSGDAVIGIEGDSTLGMSVEEAVQRIRGEVGTPVNLTILREGEEVFDVTITRDIITIPTIEIEEVDGVFVIRIFNFSASVVSEFESALQSYKDSGLSKLIIDVRGNPGGFLDAAIDITSYFVPKGEPVVYEVGGEEETVHRSKGFDIGLPETDMVVLVNGGSASASEILAGALSEYDIATLVGTQTFGKGSVQQVFSLHTDNGSLIKLTVAQWYTPNRQSISENGLDPDYEVEMTFDDIDSGGDPQLDRAIELLK